MFAFLRKVRFNEKDGGFHHYCGYVGVDDKSKYPISYNEALFGGQEDYLENYIKVHGEITFTGTFREDVDIIPLTSIPENWYEHFIYGFDLNHYDDDITGVSKDFEYAKEQALSLLHQLEHYGENK